MPTTLYHLITLSLARCSLHLSLTFLQINHQIELMHPVLLITVIIYLSSDLVIYLFTRPTIFQMKVNVTCLRAPRILSAEMSNRSPINRRTTITIPATKKFFNWRVVNDKPRNSINSHLLHKSVQFSGLSHNCPASIKYNLITQLNTYFCWKLNWLLGKRDSHAIKGKYLCKILGSMGSRTNDIKTGDWRPNCEKLRNLTSPSKVKGIASCLMMLVISSTNSSCKKIH